MKTYPRLLATIGLAALCTCAAGQSVTQSGNLVTFTFTEAAMRIPVTLPVSTVTGQTGPNLKCHGAGAVEPDVSDGGRATIFGYAGDLKGSLTNKVYGKSVAELNQLLSVVGKTSGQGEKLEELFGIRGPRPGRPETYTFKYFVEDAQLRQLQTGQAVTPTHVVTDGIESLNCYTQAQIDQVIAEGVRVVTAIVQALQKGVTVSPGRVQ